MSNKTKYRLLMHPKNANECYLDDEEYETVNEAVLAGVAYGTEDFLVIQIVAWKAIEASND